jgi:hypothetical protein
MKRGVLVGKFRPQKGSCYGLCALCVLCGKRDDYYEKGGVSREIRATESTEDTEGRLLRSLWQKKESEEIMSRHSHRHRLCAAMVLRAIFRF